MLWKHIKTEDDNVSIPPPFIEANDEEDSRILLPVEYFRTFLTADMFDSIVYQSNLYSVQKDPQRPLQLNRHELEKWLGMCFHFSVSKIPETKLHWAPETGNDQIVSIMSRNRWQAIKANLHFVDNSNIDPNDKIFKIRPLVDLLRAKFKEIPKIENLCVDEQIIPFKGASSLKQYMPKKPHKWGYKCFILADSKGMVYDFIPYLGKITPVAKENIPDLGPSSNIVLHLAESIPAFKNHKLYFDNWFTSLPLISHLASRGIWCTGTVQARRLPCLKFKSDKELQARGRGSSDVWTTSHNDVPVRAVKWLDTKSVCLISTCFSTQPSGECLRFDRKTKTQIEVTLPNIVNSYNKNMGGVDLHDQLMSLYRMSFKSRKYYQRLIFHFIDMAVANSWLLYRRDAEKLKKEEN